MQISINQTVYVYLTADMARAIAEGAGVPAVEGWLEAPLAFFTPLMGGRMQAGVTSWENNPEDPKRCITTFHLDLPEGAMVNQKYYDNGKPWELVDPPH